MSWTKFQIRIMSQSMPLFCNKNVKSQPKERESDHKFITRTHVGKFHFKLESKAYHCFFKNNKYQWNLSNQIDTCPTIFCHNKTKGTK